MLLRLDSAVHFTKSGREALRLLLHHNNQSVFIYGTPIWRMLLHRWEAASSQHDASEFLAFLLSKLCTPVVTWRWEARLATDTDCEVLDRGDSMQAITLAFLLSKLCTPVVTWRWEARLATDTDCEANVHALAGDAELRVSACSREKLTIFTDASFEKEGAGLGGILYNSQAYPLKWFAEWIDPRDLVPFGSEIKDGLIFELEVFASVQGAIDLLEGRRVHLHQLFTDNQAALACLITGRAEGIAACILQKLVSLEEECDINFWFEWVPSQSNPADAPSRKE
eukprot:s8365_g1.t1